MQWFYNLKISNKLLLAFSIVILLSAFLGYFANNGLKTVNTCTEEIKNNWLPSVIKINKVIDALNLGRRGEIQIALCKTKSERDDWKVKLEERRELINKATRECSPYISTDKEKEIFAAYNEALKKYLEASDRIFELSDNNKTEEAITVLRGESTELFNKVINLVEDLIKENENGAALAAQEGMETYLAASNTLISVVAAIILISIFLALFISRIISRPVNMVVRNLNQLNSVSLANLNSGAEKFASGDIDVSIESGVQKLDIDTKDEIGILANALNEMTDKTESCIISVKRAMTTIADMTKEINILVEAAVNGRLSARGNATKFKGEFGNIITGLNNTLDAVIGPLNVAAEYVDRISKGAMPEKITETYRGDFNEIKNNLNGCIDAINLMISDINILGNAAIEGRLDTRADVTRHYGDFRKIVTGMNNTLDIITEPLHLASKYMDDISKGVLPKKITAEYKGEYAIIKTSINDLINTTEMILTGTTRISTSIVDGNLEDRGRAHMVPGEWGALIQNINRIIDTLVGNIKISAGHISNIAIGKIPEKIETTYKGDYEKIKVNLNICFASIKALINDMRLLSNSAIEGKLSTRADATKHQGDFRKIVEGVNDTLDAVINPVNIAADYVDKLSKGEVPKAIDGSFKGDFALIQNNLNALINIFNGFVTAQNEMAVKHDQGWIDEEIAAEKFPGIYSKMARSINNLVKSHIDVKMKVVEVVGRYSAGDFTVDMDKLPGQKARITEAVDKVKASLLAVNQEIIELAKAAGEGELSKRANADKFGYSFKEMVLGINKILDSITAPINEGVGTLQKMAEGDFTIEIKSDYKGDYQLIKNSINTVNANLNKALSEVKESVIATAGASNQISSSAEEMAAGAMEQTTQTSEVAGAVEEMTRTILETTKNVSLAAETAKNAGAKAREGEEIVNKTIDGMNKISEVVSKSAETVQELGKSSDQIGEIVQVIDDIADQTNLLALNAAIEAARAGEQGRGFAVVADEVRKLAERTTKATKEIADMIRKIQQDTKNAVNSMELGTGEVENGKKLVNQAGNSLSEIMESSQMVLDIVSRVAAASEEQSTAAEEISKNVESISAVTQQSASGTQQIAHSAEDLNRLMINLENLIGQFKVNVTVSGHARPKALMN
jgi:methyl-accepting chemotaxis protein